MEIEWDLSLNDFACGWVDGPRKSEYCDAAWQRRGRNNQIAQVTSVDAFGVHHTTRRRCCLNTHGLSLLTRSLRKSGRRKEHCGQNQTTYSHNEIIFLPTASTTVARISHTDRSFFQYPNRTTGQLPFQYDQEVKVAHPRLGDALCGRSVAGASSSTPGPLMSFSAVLIK